MWNRWCLLRVSGLIQRIWMLCMFWGTRHLPRLVVGLLLQAKDAITKTPHNKLKVGKKKGAQLPSRTPVVWKEEHQQCSVNWLRPWWVPTILTQASTHPSHSIPMHLKKDWQWFCTSSWTRRWESLGMVPEHYAAEKNYRLYSGKPEFIALKWSIWEKFRDYLFYASHFTMYMDNNPMTYILSTAKLNTVGHR